MSSGADASKVRLLVLDADGTLTDGGILVDGHGLEMKRFSVRDGFAVRCWLRAGRELAVITGRGELALRHRLSDLGVRHLVAASGPKGAVIEDLCRRVGVTAPQTAAMGDDLPDLPMLRRVGYPMAVGDAVDEVKKASVWTAASAGGHGAVREAVEHLLRAAGEWAGVVEGFR